MRTGLGPWMTSGPNITTRKSHRGDLPDGSDSGVSEVAVGMQADRSADFSEDALREQTVDAVLAALRDEALFWHCKHVAKEEVIKPQHDSGKVPVVVAKVLQRTGLKMAIKNFAHARIRQLRREYVQVARLSHPELPLPPVPVPLSAVSALDAVEWAQRRWSQLALTRLRELSSEQRQPILRPRGAVSMGAGGECAAASPTYDEEVTTRHIVDLDDLYDILTSGMRGHAGTQEGGLLGRGLQWSSLGVHLHAETLDDLREWYQDLSPEFGHLGVQNDQWHAAGSGLIERRYTDGRDALANSSVPQIQVFCRFGVPAGLRREMWTKILIAAPLQEPTVSTLQDVARGVCLWEWLTDDVLRLDVAEHCANDTGYFPFDEIVEAMILALSRDASIPGACEGCAPQVPIVAGPPVAPASASSEQAPQLTSGCGGGAGLPRSGSTPPRCGDAMELVPPCGVVPFRGFSYYACPFSFLSDKLEVAYPLFRAVYCRYFCKLHTISGEPGTLLPLCALFESLLFTAAPQISFHLVQMGPKAAPLRLAFQWIVRGFVGFLKCDQVLWLWDRILGFDSVELIAVLAAAVFDFRARLLLKARTPEDVSLVLYDISGLHAVPLLQNFLFAEEMGCHDDA